MVKKLMLAVAMVTLLAAPSFAAVQNVKIGGSLVTTSVMRNNVQNVAVGVGGNQNDILSQAGISVAADLTDNVSTMLKLVNERVWGTYSAGTNTNTVDLDTAYVTMKELFFAPLSVTVGRQPLAYGNQLVIGDGDATSSIGVGSALMDLTGGVNFDAIKAVLAYDPLTVDVFAARINNGARVGEAIGATHDNANLYGVNANYKMGDKMSTVVEAYAFADVNDNAVTPTYKKQTTTYTPGLRVSTNPIEGLNVQLEGAWQTGKVADTVLVTKMTDRNAFAFQSKVNYALPVMKDMKPVLGAEYKYLSGNTDDSSLAGNNSSTKTTAWSAPYANQDVGRIYYAKGIAGSNFQLAALSFEMAPLKDLTAKATINGLWKAQKAAYDYNVDKSSLYYGTEADLDLTYAYTEDVKFGVSAGYLTTGSEALNNGLNNVSNASQVLSSVSVLF